MYCCLAMPTTIISHPLLLTKEFHIMHIRVRIYATTPPMTLLQLKHHVHYTNPIYNLDYHHYWYYHLLPPAEITKKCELGLCLCQVREAKQSVFYELSLGRGKRVNWGVIVIPSPHRHTASATINSKGKSKGFRIRFKTVLTKIECSGLNSLLTESYVSSVYYMDTSTQAVGLN
ncbi:hypothetical protein GQX74_011953 [Glossina fuscipes]|nr:hypothetical protein GQX74_011953 [Glossina fuscipes]